MEPHETASRHTISVRRIVLVIQTAVAPLYERQDREALIERGYNEDREALIERGYNEDRK